MKDCSKGRIFHSSFLYPFSVFSSCYIARDHNNRRTNGRRTKSSNELFSSLVVLTCKNCFLICQISISTRNAGGELRATKKREWMAWGGMGKKTRYYPTPEKRINIYWQQKVRFRRERFAALFFNNLRGGVVGGGHSLLPVMALRQSCEKLRVVKMLAGGRCWAALTGERRDMGTHSQTNLKIRCFSVFTYQRRKDM